MEKSELYSHDRIARGGHTAFRSGEKDPAVFRLYVTPETKRYDIGIRGIIRDPR